MHKYSIGNNYTMVYERRIEKKTKMAVVGLGYVGLPIALAFSKMIEVIGLIPMLQR